MSLVKQFTSLTETKIIIEASNEDVILNKIGIPQQVYSVIKKEIPSKYRIWVANNILVTTLSAVGSERVNSKSDVQSIKARYKNETDFNKERIQKHLKSFSQNRRHLIEDEYSDFIERIIQNNKAPRLDIKKEVFTLDDVMQKLEEWGTIRDWYYGATPRPNIPSMNWNDAYEQAEQWHSELESSGKQLDIKEGQKIIHKFDDGYYWLDIGVGHCKEEGDAMGHCGNTYADTILSLRDPHGEPHVTVAYDYNGTYRQIKGKGNDKPDEKYHKYIIELFINHITVDGERYIFERYDPEYHEKSDFQLNDLNNKLLKRVLKKADKKNLKEHIKKIPINRLLESTGFKFIRVEINKDAKDKLKELTNRDKWWEIVYRLSKEDKLLNVLLKIDRLSKKDYNLINNSKKLFVNPRSSSITTNYSRNKQKLINTIKNDKEFIVLSITDNHRVVEVYYK